MYYKKPLLYIIFFSIITTILFAQAPGHLGKRFVLGYGAHFSPAFSNGDARNNTIVGHKSSQQGSAKTGQFAYNYTHEAYMEYVLSPRFMLGFSGKFYKTVYDNGLDIFSDNSNYSNNNINYKIDNNVNGHYTIQGRSLCLYGKLYRKRYVAPWGRYIVFGPVINLYSATYDAGTMNQIASTTFNDPNNYYNSVTTTSTVSNFGASLQSFTGFNIVFGWGRSRIIANRITLDYGINMQVLTLITLYIDQISSSSSSNSIFSPRRTQNNYIEQTSGQRIRGLNLFNAFVKVGFLIF
jgi:hypothetical protein